MKLYIVRHGETQWNKEEVFRGRKDVPLNETGLWQAERTGAFFSNKKVEVVYSSPLARATQTAEAICLATGARLSLDHAFIDMDFGPWEGLSLANVRTSYPQEFETWRKVPHRFRMAGAETLAQVRRRVREGLQRIETQANGTAVITTHRVICKLLALHFLGASNNAFWRVKVDPAGITLVEQKEEEIAVSFLNQTSHLQDPAHPSEYRDF
ncbi:MAG: histidine phosphatase family protein [candidate division WOR-3 bacterium]